MSLASTNRSLLFAAGVSVLAYNLVSAAQSGTFRPVLFAQGATLRPVLLAQGAAADAAAHKQWMNDASDAQEDYRFAVTDKDQKGAVEALGKLEALMAKTEDYWTAKKAADGVRLARETRALAAQAGIAAKAGNTSAATAAFEKMGASCNTCHELHLEKR